MKCPYCLQDPDKHSPGCPNLCTLDDAHWAISIYHLGRDRSVMGLPCPADASPTYKLGYHFGELLTGKSQNISEDPGPGT